MSIWTTKDIPAQHGKVAVVTGANSGIGWYTALELARAGAEVILTARTPQKGRDAVERITAVLPNSKVRFELLDLASLTSIRAFARIILQERKLDLLINNAGVMAVPKRQETQDGFELQFGTNFLGPFAMTLLLLPALERAQAARVTTVSSATANLGLRRIQFEDPMWKKSYSPTKAYCQSKLADLMFMLELGRRCEAVAIPILCNGAHPGFAKTNLQTSGRGTDKPSIPNRLLAPFLAQDAASGALPTLRAATSLDTATGIYYAPSKRFHMRGDPVPVDVPKPALDVAAARQLWALSEELTRVHWTATTQTRPAFLRA